MIIKIFGNGKNNIVLLHGWGINSNIWYPIINRLSTHFRIYIFDLPGYCDNEDIEIFTIKNIAKEIVSCILVDAIWLGWSLGGLVIMQIAKDYPNLVNGLITVASSPCFTEKKDWPGIKKLFLLKFIEDFQSNPIRTINKFLVLQNLYTKFYKTDLIYLKKVTFSKKIPKTKILLNGLKILYQCDFRIILSKISAPILHIYGDLDIFIPQSVIPLISKICINSKTVILKNTAHIPFLSKQKIFCKILYIFTRMVNSNTFNKK